jgi:MFS family permease
LCEVTDKGTWMTDALPRSKLRRSRAAVIAIFFVNGALLATWASRIPAIRDQTRTSTAQLGIALFAAAVGAVLAMNVAGSVMARHGSRPVTTAMSWLLCMSLLLLALAPNWPVLVACLFVFGVANGAMDVGMNTQAVEIEHHWKRPILSSFHACYSLGGLAGAGVSSILAARHIAPLPHFAGTSIVFGGLIALATPLLLPVTEDVSPPVERSRFKRPPLAILILCAIVFCIVLGEGAIADWSALYLTSIGATLAVAAAGYAVFSLAMAATRFCGDSVTLLIGKLGAIRLGAVVATAGLAFALLIPAPVSAIIGMGIVGAGFAVVFPTAISLAGSTPRIEAGAAIATVTTFGYVGLLIGPILIGGAASVVTIHSALGIVVALSAIASVLTFIRPATYAAAQVSEEVAGS